MKSINGLTLKLIKNLCFFFTLMLSFEKQYSIMLFQIMNNIYQGPVIKIVGKVILTAALYAVAYGLSNKIWR